MIIKKHTYESNSFKPYQITIHIETLEDQNDLSAICGHVLNNSHKPSLKDHAHKIRNLIHDQDT